MYCVQCTMYSVPCTVYNVVYNVVFNVQCSVKCTAQCTIYSRQCTVYNVQYTMYSIQCTDSISSITYNDVAWGNGHIGCVPNWTISCMKYNYIKYNTLQCTVVTLVIYIYTVQCIMYSITIMYSV